jgi:peptide chain release factor 1
MKDSIRLRLDKAADRFEEVGRLLADPAVDGGSKEFRELSMEYARLTPLAEGHAAYRRLETELAAAEAMAGDADADMRALGAEEAAALRERLGAEERELRRLLMPADPRDARNIYLEIRAGTGGDEAAIFAGDLFRMYCRYAERRGWQVETLSVNPGEHGGYREVISRVVGAGAFSRLKFESGTHRVQRVPATEAQGRIHTSTVTVAVMPEAQEIDVVIKPEDLEINVCRAGGHGGQGVNTTDSAVRILHKPTGTEVRCQDERSQLKNKAKAMIVLRSRLLERKLAEEAEKVAKERKEQVGTGERSEKSRTYNFPQNRVTDHRVDLTLYNLSAVIEGDLDPLIEPLMADELQRKLAELKF